MYRCKDCKAEYLDKPEYCDCGNNSFEEIESPVSAGDFVKKESSEINFWESPKQITKKTFLEQYPKFKEVLDSLDVLSTSIFVLCLILSILSWVFIGKDDSHIKSGKKPTHHVQKKIRKENIPDIDSFWNNTPPAEKPHVEQQPSPNPVPIPILNEAPEQVIQPNQPAQSRKQLVTVPTAPVVLTKPVPHKNEATPSSVSKKTASLNPAVMSSYKNSLRRALFSRLAVTSVLGVGRCEIEFSVDKNGKLLGRKFSKLSDNKSLNDAVYNMLMSLPQFNPPPSGYNGEKIRFSFYFNNGYYEVSY